MEVSVIIPHHKGVDLLKRCLDSVYKSEGIDYECILVTSDSGLHTGVWLKEYPALRVLYAEGGPAYKRNYGVQFASGDYYAFLDDDVEVSPYCLYNLWFFMQTHPKCGMEFCKIYNMERRKEFDDCGSWLTPTGFLYARAGNSQVDRGQYDEPCRILASKSATCIVRRDIFGIMDSNKQGNFGMAVGGFDSDYYILGEETDLAWRCWLRGWEVWYNPRAVSWHAFGTSLKPKGEYYTLARIHFHGSKNYIQLLCTNLGLLRLSLTLPIHVTIWCVSAVGFLLRGDFLRCWYIFAGIGWNISNLGSTLSKRRRVQASRRITDRQLLPLVSYNPPVSYYLGRLRRYVTQGLHG